MQPNRKAYREHRPCAALAPLVKCYWTITGPIDEDKRVVRILPDGCMDIIFDLRGGLLPAHLPEAATGPSAFLCGVMHTHLLVRQPRNTVIAGIRFRPGGAGILPAPATEFADRNIPIKDIFPGLAPMADFLAEAQPTSKQLVRVMENHLLDRLRLDGLENSMTLAAATRLGSLHMPIPVAALAKDMGINQKTLERSFKRLIGLTPKKFARVNRLLHSVQRLSKATRSLADLALISGYTDQAHFTREFKEFTGVTPSQFQAKPDTVDFLQDVPHCRE